MHSSGQSGKMDLNHCWGGFKLPQPSWEQFVFKIHILNGHTLCPPVTLLLRIYPGEIMEQIHVDMHICTCIM